MCFHLIGIENEQKTFSLLIFEEVTFYSLPLFNKFNKLIGVGYREGFFGDLSKNKQTKRFLFIFYPNKMKTHFFCEKIQKKKIASHINPFRGTHFKKLDKYKAKF